MREPSANESNSKAENPWELGPPLATMKGTMMVYQNEYSLLLIVVPPNIKDE